MGNSRFSRTPDSEPEGFGKRQLGATSLLFVTAGADAVAGVAPDLHPFLEGLAQHGVWAGLGWVGIELVVYAFDKRSLHLLNTRFGAGQGGDGAASSSKSPSDTAARRDDEDGEGLSTRGLHRV